MEDSNFPRPAGDPNPPKTSPQGEAYRRRTFEAMGLYDVPRISEGLRRISSRQERPPQADAS